MDELRIQGPTKLEGEIRVSPSKNACLPLLAASILNKHTVTFKSLPQLRDVKTMVKILESLGAKTQESGDELIVDTREISSIEAKYELVKTMRASFFVLGPLLARNKKAKVSLPGGCAIGSRPIDIHLDGLKKLGAKITLEAGYVLAEADELIGNTIAMSFPSVGATENIMMAACLAKGNTTITNAAREPEIIDLANFLNLQGAKISGAGESVIEVEGIEELNPLTSSYEPIPDRIEAITFIISGLITKSKIFVDNVCTEHIKAALDVLEKMGAEFTTENNGLWVTPPANLKGVQVNTAPYPGFPTDAQAQLVALASMAETPSVISEHIFENRFMHVPELIRMGANIILKGNSAFIAGGSHLTGAPVMCTDLRASAALVLAGLVAKGETVIKRVYHLDRGYELIEEKLKNLGVKIERYNPGPSV